MHVYNMVGYYIIVYVLASPILERLEAPRVGGLKDGLGSGFGLSNR